MTDVQQLVTTETATLVAALHDLDHAQWDSPSLCTGWRVRDATAHLLMPYELSIPGFLGRMITARFNFDTVADRWARRDARTPQELVAALAATPEIKFNVPGAPPEAPLSHLVIHSEDIARPLGLTLTRSAEAAGATLDQITRQGFVRAGLLDGLALRSTDTDWRQGDGSEVHANAAALIATISGRTAALDDLDGPGADQLRARLSTS